MAKPVMPPGRELQLSNLAWVEDDGPVYIDWACIDFWAEPQFYAMHSDPRDYAVRDRHVIARMLVAVRDGTWRPWRPMEPG